MKLNLGCGDQRIPGCTNVDLRPEVADVVADVSDLPFGDGQASDILAFDILEHFPAARIGEVLAEWRRVMAGGGMLTVRVPNMVALAHALVDRNFAADVLIRNVYGGHRWGPDGAWDAHHWGWTPETLSRDLAAAGFDVFDNDRELNMTAKAVAR